jgi:phosphatidylglycerophosphatase A
MERLALPMMADIIGGWELVLILAIGVTIYGAKRLPELMVGVGRGLREFRRVSEELGEELNSNPKESGLVYEALTNRNETSEFVYPHRSDFGDTLRTMILFIAQGFGVGRIPFAPGTFGSFVGFIWFACLLATGRYEVYLLGALGGFALSVWLCGAAEKILKQRDPSSVVLDEIIAIPFCFLPWVTFQWLPQQQLPSLGAFISGDAWWGSLGIFVLFRIFDIAKPWPIRQSQNLPGGWGVTIDDLLAAVYVGLISLFFVR